VEVTVVGAGVIGAMSAHALVHRGHTVRVVARELGDETTSARAAASFKPSIIPRTGPYRRLLLTSRAELDRWFRDGFAEQLGIVEVRHVEASESPLGVLDHLDVMREVRRLTARAGDQVPGGYAHAVSYRTALYDVPVTLPALMAHVTEDHEVPVERGTVEHLEEVATGPDRTIVNATGLGARDLASDAAVTPVRGQTVLVPPCEDATASISADGSYAYPRSDGLVLGGTAEHGVWDTEPRPEAIARIIAANARVLPHLVDAEPLTTSAGLRPYRRGGVRLAVGRIGTTPVVHAYGHGGSGWTLGPGTAVWVARTVDALERNGFGRVSGGVGR
jgi:D-amino-acid oxidase